MTIIHDPAKAQALTQELSALLDKGAIKPVDPLLQPGALLDLLSGNKERLQTPSYPRLEGSQQVPEGPEVPHAKHCILLPEGSGLHQ